MADCLNFFSLEINSLLSASFARHIFRPSVRFQFIIGILGSKGVFEVRDQSKEMIQMSKSGFKVLGL